LLNSAGEVIGVNTAIIDGAQGLGFAIPSSLVQKNVSDLIAGRAIGRPYMGVNYYSLDLLRQQLGDKYSKLGVAVEQGALLAEVVPGGPAARAGLRGGTNSVSMDGYPEDFAIGGDIILRIDGAVVTGSNLTSLVRRYNPGNVLNLTILRNGQELEVKMTLGTWADN